MLKWLAFVLMTFTLAPWTLAQAPPPPPADDFPQPHPSEGKKKMNKKTKELEPDRQGVKPPAPVTPPVPEPTTPED